MMCFVKLWLVNLLDLVNTVALANFHAEYIYSKVSLTPPFHTSRLTHPSHTPRLTPSAHTTSHTPGLTPPVYRCYIQHSQIQ